jgi:hypothetical protein
MFMTLFSVIVPAVNPENGVLRTSSIRCWANNNAPKRPRAFVLFDNEKLITDPIAKDTTIKISSAITHSTKLKPSFLRDASERLNWQISFRLITAF